MIITTTPTINLGSIKPKSINNFTFNITNNSTNNITLSVSATCGCTKPILEKTMMGPMEMQYGRGTFNAPSARGAIHNKHIVINDSLGYSLTIKIEGNVI